MKTLTEIAQKNGTDKWGSHYYTPHYDHHFSHLRDKPISVLEIGVGGYDNPNAGGGSLRSWKEYFPNATIYAIDIYDKRPHEDERIKIFKGSQVDEKFLLDVIAQTGPLDIIIDDGSHVNEHIISSFGFLFQHLKDDGIYAVEDLQTSYWRNYGGSSFNLKSNKTAMNYFKQLTDSLNYQEIDNPFYKPSYFDRHIVAMSFYHNMVFIQKGDNNEGSTEVVNNMIPSRRKRKTKYYLRYIRSLFGMD
ncbi:MAG: class I SAM-dependent methyltransferase [Gammaproteobacteria bacterium]|nr:class I SAM-dependent methyltransferase [Gammaproteobacteria bacterium]